MAARSVRSHVQGLSRRDAAQGARDLTGADFLERMRPNRLRLNPPREGENLIDPASQSPPCAAGYKAHRSPGRLRLFAITKGSLRFLNSTPGVDHDARMDFLADACNRVRDLYGFPRATSDEVRVLVK
jgi:hypothetical protein